MDLLKTRLKSKMLVTAETSDLQHLRVLLDETSYKTAQKMYKSYISEQDFSKFHAFMLELDRLLSKFGGHPLPVQDPNDPNSQPNGNGKQQQQPTSKQQGNQQPQQQPPARRPTPTPAPVEDDQDE